MESPGRIIVLRVTSWDLVLMPGALGSRISIFSSILGYNGTLHRDLAAIDTIPPVIRGIIPT